MPFYEYQCSSCHHHLEVMQKVDAPRLKKCPNCGKSTLSRLISAPVFRLAGSGWYETDFKSDKENKRNLVGGPETEPAKADAGPDSKDSKDSKEKAAAPEKPASKDDGKDKGADKPAVSDAGAKGQPASRKPASRTPLHRPTRKAAAKGRRR